MTKESNFDRKTVDGFGDEWSRFDQSKLSYQELNVIFDSYFSIVKHVNQNYCSRTTHHLRIAVD